MNAIEKLKNFDIPYLLENKCMYLTPYFYIKTSVLSRQICRQNFLKKIVDKCVDIYFLSTNFSTKNKCRQKINVDNFVDKKILSTILKIFRHRSTKNTTNMFRYEHVFLSNFLPHIHIFIFLL